MLPEDGPPAAQPAGLVPLPPPPAPPAPTFNPFEDGDAPKINSEENTTEVPLENIFNSPPVEDNSSSDSPEFNPLIFQAPSKKRFKMNHRGFGWGAKLQMAAGRDSNPN